MTVAAGTRLGSYEVLGSLGAGGMGEVYRARDTKLNRDVAIKVLPEAFALDADRLARFTREAQVLASLNHPNIAAIYGLEQNALVMELVEGEDLSQRIARLRAPGASARQAGMALDEALPIARQIAEALEAAHEQGIVHRDLKPANVKVRPDGTVKVLDFGLAKALDNVPEGRHFSAAENSPTITTPAMTMRGMILGTAAYMSPEQAKGRVVDKRADIWAFGVVLYEMLTGRRVFDGEDTSELLAAVLRQDIPWSALPASTPPRLRRLLERCLDRDARTRLRDIGEARVELARIESGAPGGEGATSSPASRRASYREVAAWAVAALSLVAAVAIYLRPSAPEPDDPVVQLALVAPDGVTFGGTDINDAIAISPNGRLVVFTGRSTEGNAQLYVRPLDSREVIALPGTENAINPFWSPDSRAVGFGAQGKLQRIDLAGGRPTILAAAPRLTGGAWSRNGLIAFIRNWDSGIFQVPDHGGEATEVVAPEASRGLTSFRSPDFVADGQRFLFRAGGKIRWASVTSSGTGEVTEGGSPRFIPPDRLLFARGDTLFTAVLDGETMTISGEPVPVLPADGQPSVAAQENPFSASHTGVLMLRQPWTPGVQLTWFNRQGAVLGPIGGGRRATTGMRMPRISPDGTRVATQVRNADERLGIWVIDLERQLPNRVHAGRDGEDAGQLPQWAGDGRHLAFHLLVKGVNGIYRKSATGLGAPELLMSSSVEGGGLAFPRDWSRDGRYLLYWVRGDRTRGDVWALPLTGERKPFPILNSEFDETEPALSPDGRWLAYRSDASGTYEIYLQTFTAEGRPGGDRVRISARGGRQPRFRGDGRELFYLADDDQLMAVAINGSGTIAGHGEPQALFKARVEPRDDRNSAADYDVSPDGQRFLVNAVVDGGAPPPPTVVLNWAAGLKQ